MWYETKIREPTKPTRLERRPRRIQRFLGLVAESKDEETKKFLEDIEASQEKIRIKEGLVFFENKDGIQGVLTIHEYCKKLAKEIQGRGKK